MRTVTDLSTAPSREPARRRIALRLAAPLTALALVGCGREEVLHGLEESQANQGLVSGRRPRERSADGMIAHEVNA